jgi:hypothetical protein
MERDRVGTSTPQDIKCDAAAKVLSFVPAYWNEPVSVEIAAKRFEAMAGVIRAPTWRKNSTKI